VLHLFRREQADQHRGVPVLAAALSTFRSLSKYLEAELTAARVAACISMFVKRSGLTDDLPPGFDATTDAHGDARVLERLEPGVIEYLDPGEEIQTFKTDRPGTTFDPFVTRMLRAISAAVGLPYELVVRDFSKTNYSSMRAALLETRRGFRCDQALLANLVLQPIRELVLEEAYARGMLPAVPGFLDLRPALFRTRWVPPACGWVDPTKEIQASRDAVEGGLSTLADEASSNGQDWSDVAEARARELVRLRELEEQNDLPPGSLSGLTVTATADEGAREGNEDDEDDEDESGPDGSSTDDEPDEGDEADEADDEDTDDDEETDEE
jgi:lambda family phage portal protein